MPSSSTFAHGCYEAACGFVRDKYLLGLAAAGLTLPVWHALLKSASENAATLAPIVLLGVAVLKFYKEWPRSEADQPSAFARVASHFPRLKSIGMLLAAVVTLGAIFLFVSKGDAKASPAALVEATKTTGTKRRRSSDDAGEDDTDEETAGAPESSPAWYQSAYADLGVAEGPGKVNSKTVLAYYRDAGHPEIKHDEVPWCMAFVCAHLERNGVPSPKSLAVMDLDTWGEDVTDSPQVGDVVRMWRESPKSWKGHTGFYVRETKTHVYVLGGNQGDRVSIAAFPRNRIKSIRRPRSVSESRIVRASVGQAAAGAGVAGAGASAAVLVEAAAEPVSKAIEQGEKVAEKVQGIGTDRALAIALTLVVLCGIASVALAIYTARRRAKDMRERGV